MKKDEIKSETTALTNENFQEFLSATGKEQLEILLAHAEKNKEILEMKKKKERALKK